MGAFDCGHHDHRARLGWRERPGLQTIHAKREIGTQLVIIGQVIRQQTPAMLRVEDDDML